MNIIQKEFASEVVSYDNLHQAMLFDTAGTNIYIMNFNTATKLCQKWDIQLNPSLTIYPHVEIQVYGYCINILSAMPDDEILIIDKNHPNW